MPPHAAPRAPFVTIVMPVRNEADGIDEVLASLLAQDYPADRLEVIVLDGRSTDTTRERVAAIALRDARVRLFDNPGVIVSTAINRGFARARGELVVRVDGHSIYARDYVGAVVRAFAESGADVVGGPMVAERARLPLQRAIAAALGSRFGMGGAAFHFAGARGPAEAVYLGAYRADALRRFGGFDEQLVRDEDDEWFARARGQGARVWLDPRIRSSYQPRTTLRALLRQYFEYGLWKPLALRKVAGSLRARQLAPSTLVLAFALPLIAAAALRSPALAALAALPLLAYAAALACALRGAPHEAGEPRWRALVRQAAVFAAMHLGYGAGFLAGLARRRAGGSTAQLRAVYAAYARDPLKRRAWNAADAGQREIVRERDDALAAALRRRFGARVAELTILDLGAGDRDLATALAAAGATPRRVVACDLLAERLAENPAELRIAADARMLPFADGSFDVVVQCTMFSSLTADATRRVVASEMARVCRSDGLLLSYDARHGNPWNGNVRRLAGAELARLFPGHAIARRPLTVVPPLARRFPRLVPRLRRIPALLCFDLAAIDARPSCASAGVPR